jgi:phosphoribosyl 1,2-cyclic phosphodiesterase
MPYKFSVLASGSAGNCSVHDPAGDGNCFLIDSGISDKKIDAGLAGVNRHMGQVHSVLITHEHGDHYPLNKRGRKYDSLGQRGTDKRHKWLDDGIEEIDYTNCSCVIHRVPMVHDVHCDGFVITSYDGIKVVHITDTSEVPDVSMKYMEKPRSVIIEANRDDYLINENLKNSMIPECVLNRSIDTHLSNAAMADVVEQLMWDGLEVVVLIHLSSSNNSPDLARQAAEEVLEKGGFLAGKGDGKCRVIVSGQDKPTELIILRGDYEG